MASREDMEKMTEQLEVVGLKVYDPKKDYDLRTLPTRSSGCICDLKLEKISVVDPIMLFTILESECEVKDVNDPY
jgi:hypothetical protein